MLGVCYYPEHWPEDWWAADARRIRDLGIAYVRIGEFAWSHYEPRRAEFAWEWLDRAMEILGSAGLKIVLGTPTATPLKWLMDEFPGIAPIDEQDGRAVLAPADTTRSRRRPIGARARASSKRSLSVTAGIQR
jgi:beta-galactosidase